MSEHEEERGQRPWHKTGPHDDDCESEFISGPMAYTSCACRARAEAVGMSEDDISDMARRFSLWLNDTYPPELDFEALHWRRVTKVCEEAGEVRDALGAWVHENPRKPAGPLEDVISELADCVGAALGAIEHLTAHEGRSLDIATARLRFVCERVGVEV